MKTHALRTAALLGMLVPLWACGEANAGDDTGEEISEAARAGEERAAEPAPTAAPVQPASDGSSLPAGTTLRFRLAERISTQTHEGGESFQATLIEDVRGADGQVVLPAGTSAWGTVSRADADGGPDGEAVLAVAIESVEVDGEPHAIHGRATEVDLETEARDSGAETAGKVAVGTAAGALLGQILGRDTEATLKGAGVGTVVGAVVALGTRDGHATMPEGSTVTVQLDAPLTD
ncbi:MAG: hypothetical protein R3E98_00775 [Gemmatimonadota bacterium]